MPRHVFLLMWAAAMTVCAAARAQPLPPGARYVSMGSSYAAGPGVGRPDPASGACARSLSNYARQVAAARGLRLVDVACSGATTQNILARGQHGFPAQIEAVSPDTQLVSVLIGGNDIDYVGDLGGYTCRDTGGRACRIVPDDEASRRLAALPASLRQVVDAIHARAPAARVVLVGYLPAVPASGPGVCAALPLSTADAQRMRSVAVRLAQAIGGVAAQMRTGVVRSSLIGTGHDVCSRTPFVAGAHPPTSPGWPGPVAYHPNQAGMDRVAQALETVLDSGAVPR